MERQHRGLRGPWVSRWIVFLLTLFVVPIYAQDVKQVMQMPLPDDPQVRMGKLDNGMTYYIRANKEPKDRAEFYIFHNVGAMQEEDHQDGLAHFTEHMAFNGTTRFPGKKLINFLERNGVKFGADLNAFTAMEMTCYNISDVPTNKPKLMDSCMMVLCDWSGDISMVGEEIDNERGVICEELRTREDANWRAGQVRNKALYKDSKYSKRNVIGTLDLLKSFPYSAIRDFYREWYRPDLQAIIVVGDFDAEEMEVRVKEHAGALPKRKNPRPKETYKVEPPQGLEYASYTDKEMQMTRIELYYKHAPVHKQPKNVEYFKQEFMRELVSSMLNSRFSELALREDATFVASYSEYFNMIDAEDNFVALTVAKPGESEAAFTTLVEETQRARQNGFTETELVRAKSDLVRYYQKQYDERDKTQNSSYIFNYIDHFRHGSPICDTETNLGLAQMMQQMVTLDEVNATMREMMPGKDLVVFVSASDKEQSTLIQKDKAEAIYNRIYDSKLEPWVDNVKNEPLVAELPTSGSITSTKKIKKLDAELWTLSNGMKLIVKPTDFKDDEVRVYGWAEGGYSLVADEDLYTAELVDFVASMSGLGNFDAMELEKLLAGKQASVGVSFNQNKVSVQGRSGAKVDELELLFQQIYLSFVSPRFDKNSFNTVMTQMRALLENQEKQPDKAFARKFLSALTDNHPRSDRLSSKTLDKVNFDRMRVIYEDQMKHGRNFTFIIVGNVDVKQLRPLVNLYLSSIPAGEVRRWKDVGMHYPDKPRKHEFMQGMEMPKTRAGIVYQSPIAKYNMETDLALATMEHVLDLRYTDEIREKEGGTYGVSVWYSMLDKPRNAAQMSMVFDTEPEKADKLVPMVNDIFLNLLEAGPTEEEVNKAKQHFLKAYQERLRNNGYWLNVLREHAENGADMHTGYEKAVQKMNAKQVRKQLEKIFSDYNPVTVIMTGYKSEQ